MGGHAVFKGGCLELRSAQQEKTPERRGAGSPAPACQEPESQNCSVVGLFVCPIRYLWSPFQVFTWPHFLLISPAVLPLPPQPPGIEKEQDLALSLLTDLFPVPRPQLHAASSFSSSLLSSPSRLQGRQSLVCPDFPHTPATLCTCRVSSCPP